MNLLDFGSDPDLFFISFPYILIVSAAYNGIDKDETCWWRDIHVDTIGIEFYFLDNRSLTTILLNLGADHVIKIRHLIKIFFRDAPMQIPVWGISLMLSSWTGFPKTILIQQHLILLHGGTGCSLHE